MLRQYFPIWPGLNPSRVLDLFGSDDLPVVLENRLKKAMAAQSGGNLRFQQQEIEGANHFFDDKNDELVDAVDDWLKNLP